VNAARDTTHVFYAAFSPDPDLAVEASRNANMLANVLDGLEKRSKNKVSTDCFWLWIQPVKFDVG
jgi:hypothetical protein